MQKSCFCHDVFAAKAHFNIFYFNIWYSPAKFTPTGSLRAVSAHPSVSPCTSSTINSVFFISITANNVIEPNTWIQAIFGLKKKNLVICDSQAWILENSPFYRHLIAGAPGHVFTCMHEIWQWYITSQGVQKTIPGATLDIQKEVCHLNKKRSTLFIPEIPGKLNCYSSKW